MYSVLLTAFVFNNFHPVHDNIIQNTDYRFMQILHVRPKYTVAEINRDRQNTKEKEEENYIN